MPLLISAFGAATKFLPFSSRRQQDLFVSCQHKHPVVGVPVQYWISAVLPHTARAIAREGSGSPGGNGCWTACSWALNTEISSCSSVGSYTDFERRAQRESTQEGQAEALRTKCRLHVVGWSQLGARSKAALWMPSTAGQGGKKKTKVSWVQGRGKSLANDCHGQKRLHLGKLV